MLPSNVTFGFVEGRFLVATQDGPDADAYPDGIPNQGTIHFSASIPYVINPSADPDPVVIHLAEVVCGLDAEGYLCTIESDGAGGNKLGARGVYLVATDDPDLMVTDWTWNVTYKFDTINGIPTKIDPHGIAVPGVGAVDLPTAVKVPASPGYGLPQAEAAVLRAEAAAAESITDAQVVDDDLMLSRRNGDQINAGRVKGDPGPQGPQGPQGPTGISNADQFYTVSEIAGRTVTIWDYLNNREQLIYGDTGRRNITALFNGTAPNATVGINGGTVYLTRVGRMVELNMENVTLPPGQSPSFVQLGDIIPAGFQPPNERDYSLGERLVAEGSSGGGIRINRATGRIYIYLHADGETIRVTATWFTEDPWPTSLPGTAVGTIPHQ